MKIVLLGPPGVGKGTYASILSKKFKLPIISSGNLFHKAIREKTKLGKKVQNYVSSGDLVPDEIVIEIIKKRLEKEDSLNGFLLDGFPRTINQAKALENLKKIERVLNFFAIEDEIISRLSGRRTCKKCETLFHIKNKPPKIKNVCDSCGGKLYQRSDENPEVIKKRLQVYHKKTKPLINYYKEKGLLRNIDANYGFQDIDKVIAQCEKVISEISCT